MALLRSLKHRPFVFLWSGQTISRLGDSLYRVALAWWVLEKTGSATVMGTVLIFSFTPMLLFLLLGGVAVDRFPRVRLMLASDLLRGTVVVAVAFLASARLLELWHVYAASVVFGFVDAFFQPAYTALVPEIAPPDSLPSANSLTGLSGQVTGVVGPALGAAIVGLGGTPVAFALDGLSFFASAACLVPLRGLGNPPVSSRSGSTGVLRDVREGLSVVLGLPWLWITILVAALSNITWSGPLSVALPFLVDEHLNADVQALGLLSSLMSLGSVAGAIWLGRLSRIRRRGLLAYGGWMLGGLALAAYGLPITIIGVAIAAFAVGVGSSIFGLIWMNTLQELVPRDMLGRVSSIDYLGSFVLLPAGFGIAGWMTDLLGPAAVFVIGGGITAGLAALALMTPAIRGLD